MVKATTIDYLPVPGYNGLYIAGKGKLRSFALLLKNKTLCLVSPFKGQQPSNLEALGSVSHILAPNHYHNQGLADAHQQYPKATLCAPVAAKARLVDRTSLKFKPLTSLEAQLPRGVALMASKGLKTGEVWLRVKRAGQTAWVVIDAFGGADAANKNDVLATIASPKLLGTFPKMGVADASVYKAWVLTQIKRDQPQQVLVCHGAGFAAKTLPKRLTQLVEAQWPDV